MSLYRQALDDLLEEGFIYNTKDGIFYALTE